MEHGPTTRSRRGSRRLRILRIVPRASSTVVFALGVSGSALLSASGVRMGSSAMTFRLSNAGSFKWLGMRLRRTELKTTIVTNARPPRARTGSRGAGIGSDGKHGQCAGAVAGTWQESQQHRGAGRRPPWAPAEPEGLLQMRIDQLGHFKHGYLILAAEH